MHHSRRRADHGNRVAWARVGPRLPIASVLLIANLTACKDSNQPDAGPAVPTVRIWPETAMGENELGVFIETIGGTKLDVVAFDGVVCPTIPLEQMDAGIDGAALANPDAAIDAGMADAGIGASLPATCASAVDAPLAN